MVATIVRDALSKMDPQYPPLAPEDVGTTID
jgi:hypothetical protein